MDKAEILKELDKCAKDPAYFINNYVNVVHPVKGIVPFKLFPFQERMIHEIDGNRFSLVRKFRQAGITTLAAAYSLWNIIFKEHQMVMVVSIGDRESRAFLERVVMMFDDLPEWLKPQEEERNKHVLKLSTGSRIKSQPAGAGRGGRQGGGRRPAATPARRGGRAPAQRGGGGGRRPAQGGGRRRTTS